MFKVIIILLVVGLILYMIFGIWGIIIPAAAVVVVFVLMFKNASKAVEKDTAQNQLIEDTLNSHTELGNYKKYQGGQGVVLILSENGYVAYFLNGNFTCEKIENVKSIKFIAQPFDRKTKKIIDFAGTIAYRIEVNKFSNPIIDLPFGSYKDNADKLRQTTEFADVKSTFDLIKKNAKTNA